MWLEIVLKASGSLSHWGQTWASLFFCSDYNKKSCNIIFQVIYKQEHAFSEYAAKECASTHTLYMTWSHQGVISKFQERLSLKRGEDSTLRVRFRDGCDAKWNWSMCAWNDAVNGFRIDMKNLNFPYVGKIFTKKHFDLYNEN